MNIFICADHCGQTLKNQIVQYFDGKIVDLYDKIDPDDDYPDIAKIMAKKMQKVPSSLGIAICGSGQGINIALNRNPWIRSVNPRNLRETQKTRQHNDANCICFGGDNIDFETAKKLLTTFLKTPFSGEPRHIRRIQKLTDLN
jgi:ribose 5-phosphate isomerase B